MIPLTHKAKIVKSTGIDSWGEPIAGEEVEVSCRISAKTEMVRNQNGDEVVSKGYLLFKGAVTVKDGYTLKFSNENGEEVIEIPLSIQHKRDLSGEVLFTKVAI